MKKRNKDKKLELKILDDEDDKVEDVLRLTGGKKKETFEDKIFSDLDEEVIEGKRDESEDVSADLAKKRPAKAGKRPAKAGKRPAKAGKHPAKAGKRPAKKVRGSAREKKRSTKTQEPPLEELKGSAKEKRRPAKAKKSAVKKVKRLAKKAKGSVKKEKRLAEAEAEAEKRTEKTEEEELPAKTKKHAAKEKERPAEAEERPTKKAKGSVKAEKRPAKAKKRSTEAEDHPAKKEKGSVKTEKRPAKAKKHPAKEKERSTEAEERPAKKVKGSVKAEKRPAKEEKGSAKKKDRPAEADKRPLKLEKKLTIRPKKNAKEQRREKLRPLEPETRRKGQGRVRPDGQVLAKMLGDEKKNIAEKKKEVQKITDPESHWRNTTRSIPTGWFVLLMVVLLCLFGGFLLRFMSTDKAELIKEENIGIEQGRAEDRENSRAYYEEIESVLEKYLVAETIDEKLKYVRHPERVRPYMEVHYAKNEMLPCSFKEIRKFVAAQIAAYPFIIVEAVVEGSEAEVILIDAANDEVKVDWESHVVYQESSLEELLASQSSESKKFRVSLKSDNVFRGGYTEEEYRCFIVDIGNTDEYVYGYAKRDSQAEEEILKAMKSRRAGATQGYPMILTLKYLPEKNVRDAVYIESVESPRWAYAVNPDDEPKN